MPFKQVGYLQKLMKAHFPSKDYFNFFEPILNLKKVGQRFKETTRHHFFPIQTHISRHIIFYTMVLIIRAGHCGLPQRIVYSLRSLIKSCEARSRSENTYTL
jgi:hypothetical protein